MLFHKRRLGQDAHGPSRPGGPAAQSALKGFLGVARASRRPGHYRHHSGRPPVAPQHRPPQTSPRARGSRRRLLAPSRPAPPRRLSEPGRSQARTRAVAAAAEPRGPAPWAPKALHAAGRLGAGTSGPAEPGTNSIFRGRPSAAATADRGPRARDSPPRPLRRQRATQASPRRAAEEAGPGRGAPRGDARGPGRGAGGGGLYLGARGARSSSSSSSAGAPPPPPRARPEQEPRLRAPLRPAPERVPPGACGAAATGSGCERSPGRERQVPAWRVFALIAFSGRVARPLGSRLDQSVSKL